MRTGIWMSSHTSEAGKPANRMGRADRGVTAGEVGGRVKIVVVEGPDLTTPAELVADPVSGVLH
jgi:hypothetical protein